MKNIIIIAGTPKSGVSVLSNGMRMLGLKLPDADEQNINFTINKLLFQSLDYSSNNVGTLPLNWLYSKAARSAIERIKRYIKSTQENKEPVVIADALLCRVLPLWDKAFKQTEVNPRFIFIVRHPWESAKSIVVDENENLKKAHLIWLAYFIDAMAFLKDKEPVIITFDELTADPVKSLLRIGKSLCFEWQKRILENSPNILNLIRPSIKRHDLSSRSEKDRSAFLGYEKIYQKIKKGSWRDCNKNLLCNTQMTNGCNIITNNIKRNVIEKKFKWMNQDLILSILNEIGSYEKLEKEKTGCTGSENQKNYRQLLAQITFSQQDNSEKVVKNKSLMKEEWQNISWTIPECTAQNERIINFRPLNTNGTVMISSIKLINNLERKVISEYDSAWQLAQLELNGPIIMLPDEKNLILLNTGLNGSIIIPIPESCVNSSIELSIWIKVCENINILHEYKEQIKSIEWLEAVSDVQVSIRDKVKKILNPEKISSIVKPENEYDTGTVESVRLLCILNLINNNPKPSLNNLDDKLSKHLNFENGFFVEIGGNNGYSQSNTFYLEYCKKWHGILIEGIQELSWLCRFLRMKSKTINAACVDFSYPYDTIQMRYADLMSIVCGSLKSEDDDNQHITRGMKLQNIQNSYEVKVPAKTLTSILKENNVQHIDFLSLDVEGYEANVLRGLDFDLFKPKFICVEARFFEEVDEVLKDRYSIIEQLSHHDFLYKFNGLN